MRKLCSGLPEFDGEVKMFVITNGPITVINLGSHEIVEALISTLEYAPIAITKLP